METARVFNIERFATEDGKGIRTVVFLKGCDLRCRWCANPESQSFRKQVIFIPNQCTGCGKCVTVCKKNAIRLMEEYGYITDEKLCTGCGDCTEACYNNARTPAGEDYTVDRVVKEILKDADYYRMSGGGATFSGGEPLFYSRFLEACIARLKEHGITALIETCGHISLDRIQRAAPLADYIFYDIKHMDPIKHKELTGADNRLILSNLNWLSENFKGELSVRYPYIPGCNDDREAVRSFMEHVKTLKNVSEVVFLPYHRLGLPKYRGLGRVYEMGDRKSMKKNELEYLLEIYKNYPIKIKIQ